MRLLQLLTVLVVPVVALAGCQGDAPLEVTSDQPILSVAPRAAAVDGGKLSRLTAKIRQEDGSYSQPTDVTWSSADGTVATVDGKGLVQALKAGRTQIIATWHESRGSSLVTVLDPLVKKQPSPCLALLKPGAGNPKDPGCA